jgi:hypothetical protein
MGLLIKNGCRRVFVLALAASAFTQSNVNATTFKLKDIDGTAPFCRVFDTGVGICDYESKAECEAVKDTDEVCLPRKLNSTVTVAQKKPVESSKPLQSSESTTAKDLSALLMVGPRTPSFDKTSTYYFEHYILLQKIPGGYIIKGQDIYFSSGGTVEYGPIFLKTKKQIHENIRLSGGLKYDGEFAYENQKGFGRKIPRFTISPAVPLRGVNPDTLDNRNY